MLICPKCGSTHHFSLTRADRIVPKQLHCIGCKYEGTYVEFTPGYEPDVIEDRETTEGLRKALKDRTNGNKPSFGDIARELRRDGDQRH